MTPPAPRSKPSSIILDMLRSARSRQRTVRSLISAGGLFGHSANTMRVTISRLMTKGLIESPERGLYRLTEQTDALNEFVERWRLGEDRIKPWQPNQWLLAHPSGAPKGNRWALEALGFREVRSGLFARPDNLKLELDELRHIAVGIGLDADSLLVRAQPSEPVDHWRGCWDADALTAHYESCLGRLQESAERLPQLPLDTARLECFTLGGEMVHVLAKDPLLPDVWQEAGPRAALWRATLAYDSAGKEIWAAGKAETLSHMPHPKLTQENAG